jgi:hypothetical protein
MSYEVKETPTNLEKIDDDHIAITWATARRSFIRWISCARAARGAGCVDEWTGQLLVHARASQRGPREKRWSRSAPTPSRSHFTDGHGTGIFTYKKLRMWGEHLKG